MNADCRNVAGFRNTLIRMLGIAALSVQVAGLAANATAPDVLFIVVAPGVSQPGSRCDRPVDMTALYPTLLELAGLPASNAGEGASLLPLLRDPKVLWDRPALMTYMRGNHAVRSARWRYIRYADGSEELYDHDVDPNEWNNLAGSKRFADVIELHRQWLPKTEAKHVPDLRNPMSTTEPSR